MTLPCLYIYKVAIFVRNNINLYQRNSQNHTYETRHTTQLQPTKHKTTRFETRPFLFWNKHL